MKAIVYTCADGAATAELTDRPVPEPGPGEVRVRVHRSGANPTDWKSRHRTPPPAERYVPNNDGAGTVDATGPGVDPGLAGTRVWLWMATWQRTEGTAQEFVVVPRELAVPLPDGASFDLGASLGVPALTAHRCLTIGETGPDRLGPGALEGRTVLVTGGAGAVGNAAIQLARWSGATVVTTVSGPEKGALAEAAGAHHIVNYRADDPVAGVRKVAPDGVDLVVEVAAAANAASTRAVLAPNAAVAVYAGVDADTVTLPVRETMMANARWQGVFLFTVPSAANAHGVAAVTAAVEAGALRVGEYAGLPLHHYPLSRLADAHDAGETGTVVGKILVDVIE